IRPAAIATARRRPENASGARDGHAPGSPPGKRHADLFPEAQGGNHTAIGTARAGHALSESPRPLDLAAMSQMRLRCRMPQLHRGAHLSSLETKNLLPHLRA